jgi:hypothetical protein
MYILEMRRCLLVRYEELILLSEQPYARHRYKDWIEGFQRAEHVMRLMVPFFGVNGSMRQIRFLKLNVRV